MTKFIAALSLLIAFHSAPAQERVTVKDSEIEFSFVKPNSWETYDDEYTYYVYNPRVENAMVAITYYEADEDMQIEEYFDFAIENFYPLNVPKFVLMEKGDDTVDDVPAKWLKYASTEQGMSRYNIVYAYIKHDQRFSLLGTAQKSDFEKVADDFISIMKSVKSQK